MSTPSSRPRVFLSSTIYDFADLRSAIKFWLEELGYEVNASEYNDFRKSLDLNSYDACLRSIDDSDYFILLIGGRIGGWFDAGTKTTITMQEYRRAYENAKKGRLKIVTFVRQSVWDVREDRKTLGALLRSEYAKEHSLTDEDIDRISHHRSRVIEEADTVFAFLSEVGRNAEMKAALKAGEALPPANWIHRFTSFRDIVDALQTDFTGTFGLRRVALAANLHAELLENLRRLLQRDKKGNVTPSYEWASFAREQFSGDPLDESSIVGNHLMWFSMFALTSRAGGFLRSQALHAALVSGEFLDFDPGLDRYVVGPLQQALIQLSSELERLRSNESELKFEERRWLVENFRPFKGVKDKVAVPNPRLVGAMALHDRYVNVTALSRALVVALDGGEFKPPVLYPGSPFAQQAQQIEQETPSIEDALKWTKEGS